MLIHHLRGRVPGAFLAPCMLTALALGTLAHGADKHWNTAGGSWGVAGNWLPNGVPIASDSVFMGSTVAAENAFVNLSAGVLIQALTINDGLSLDTNSFVLVVPGPVLVSGENLVDKGKFNVIYSSRLRVANGAGAVDAQLATVTVEDGADLELEDSSTLRVTDQLVIADDQSVLLGDGLVELTGNGAVALLNNGAIAPGLDDLTITQLGAGRIDLDGTNAGRTLNITLGTLDGSNYAELTINGDQLADPMDNDIWLSAHNRLTMNLSNGWTMGSGTELRMSSGSHPGPARLQGEHLDMYGDITLPGTAAWGIISTPITLRNTVLASAGTNAKLEFSGEAVVDGATFIVGQGGDIRFTGPTTVLGGQFATQSENYLDGDLVFDGPTEWNGTLQGLGVLQQLQDATVVGPTQIDAHVFNMDGNSSVSWNIAHSLTVNAKEIDLGNTILNGEITIGGGFFGHLEINITSGSNVWNLGGTLTTSGVAAIPTERISGSPMILSGDLNLDGRVGIGTYVWMYPQSVTTMADSLTELRLTDGGTIYTGATLTGGGLVVNGSAGQLTLQDNVNLNDVGLVNNGKLAVGPFTGVAFVDRFTQEASGTWLVQLGGYTPDVEHDLLFVLNGPATVAGQMDVSLVNMGNGVFDPQAGDSFIVLRASAGLAGGFANQPISYANGKVYLWSVAIDSSTVQLVLDDVVPCPADLNSDGQVNGADLGILLANWGPCEGCLGDLDGDNIVSGADLGQLLASWGPCL
jgi:hypothetical protein